MKIPKSIWDIDNKFVRITVYIVVYILSVVFGYAGMVLISLL